MNTVSSFRTPRRRVQYFVVAAVTAILALPAAAQYRASIHGTVTDAQGAVVPGATVTLKDNETNRLLTTTSDGSGIYNFNALAADHFTLTGAMKGFSNRVIENLTLIPEQANTVNVQLEIGGTTETVTVDSGAVPALDTATANISGTVTSNQIQHLPSFGRDVLTLAQLAPGVIGDGGQGSGGGVRSLPGTNQGGSGNTDGITKTENGPQVIANGNQTNTNNVLIDGVSTSSVTWGGTTVVTPSEESVDNVKISANLYDAEYGRFTGTNIQITSKSGTNRYHGSLFFKAERPGLNAYQSWAGPNSVGEAAYSGGVLKTPAGRGLNRDTGRFNQYGGSVGFPFWKDKLFGFLSYETLRRRTVSYGTGWYETPAFLKLAPSGSNAAKYLTYSGEAVQAISMNSFSCTDLGLVDGPYCHLIPGQGLDVGSPLTTPLGSYDTSRASAAVPGIGSGLDGVADIANYVVYTGSSGRSDQWYGRADAQVTAKDRLSVMVYWMPTDSFSVNGPARAINNWVQHRIGDAFTTLWNHTFSSALLNEARVNAAGWRWNEATSNSNTPFGLSPLSWGDSANNFPNGTTINSFAPNSPSIFDQWTYGYQDIATLVHSRHTTKFGGEVTRLYYLNQSVGNARLSYKFANLWNFLNDAPYQESGSFNPVNGVPTPNRQDDRNNFWGAFGQDDWKVTSNLTVNLGLRYDYFGPYYDKDNSLRVAVLGSGSAMLTGLSIRKGGPLYNVGKSNLGPQLGLAWNPQQLNHKLVIRGGFGLNYNQNEMAITANGGGNPGNTLNFTFCCRTQAGNTGTGASINYQLSASAKDPFGFPANPAAITSYDTNGLPLAGTTSVTAFDANDKTISTYHYSLDTQYDISHGWVATLGYQGSISHHLLLQQNMNVLAAVAGIPLNPRLTSVGYYGNKGNANYHALLATVKHNFAHGYQLEGQYTWAKSMDNGSSPYYADTYPQNLAYSYGRSDFNVKDAVKVFGMWQPRFFHEQLLHSTLDGWTLTGIYNWHTGFPWNPTWNSTIHQYYGGSGIGTLRPAAYYGNAGHDISNAAFKTGPDGVNAANPATAPRNKNYSQGPLAYFQLPTVSNAGGTYGTNTVVAPPQAPGVARNSFDGPRYGAIDASLTKGFHLPKMPVLGEAAIFEFRVDAYNLFNQQNLTSISNSLGNLGSNTGSTFVPNLYFGQAQGALASRSIDLQARFSF